MTIVKKLYRNTYKLYQQWNDAELVERIRNAGSLSPGEAWEQYVDLWAFCLELAPQPSDLQLKLKFSEWQKYYSRIQRLERMETSAWKKNLEPHFKLQ